MNGSCLNFDDPIRDAISRIRFAPVSNNLLISSWDSSLRLYDVDKCELRFEAPNEGSGLLDCCFESESVALSANSDGSILRYDMRMGNSEAIGNHEDLATCIEYSEETHQVISASWDKRVNFWDPRSSSLGCLSSLDMEVESMSLSGLNLMVAHKSSVHLYDLRRLDRLVQAREYFVDIQIKCVRSNPEQEGFIAGSVDGRVALGVIGQSNTNEGYVFRCHPKDRNGRQHLVPINSIAFNPCVRGVVVTGDDMGYATIWDVLNRKRLVEFPRYTNSVASLAYNHTGKLLAVASSYTYQEANEREEQPHIFIHHTDAEHTASISASGSRKA